MEMDTREMEERARMLQEKLGPQFAEAKENFDQLNRRVTTFIKENPTTCLLGALALGFVVGKIASRR